MIQAPNSKNNLPEKDVDYSALVQALKFKALDAISLLMDSMFDGADDFLFSLADKAENNQAQQAYFDIMRLLRLERPQITSEFSSHLQISLRPAADVEPFEAKTDDYLSEDDLCLIDEQTMEEMVAINAIESKTSQRHRDLLKDFYLRMDELSVRTPLSFSKEALSPKNICNEFKHAIAPINDELDIQNKLILYKLFDLMVMMNMNQVYETANKQLIEANILPVISSQIKKLPPSSAVIDAVNLDNLDNQEESLQEAVNANAVSSSTPSHYTTANSALYQTVSQYLGNGGSAQSVGGSGATGGVANASMTGAAANEFTAEHIISGLSQLQSNPASGSLLQPTEIKRALQQQLSTGQSGAITQQVSHGDSVMIELVQRLCEIILSDKSITELSRSLFLKLQIPIIKAAMIDKDLLTTANHPIKQLLDLFIEYIADIEDESDKNYVFFNNLVDEINDDFDQDTQFFDPILKKADDWIGGLLEEAAETEKGTQKRAFKDNARRAVITQLRQSLKQQHFPEAQHDLILKYWSTVMYRCHLNYGSSSSEWDAMTDFLDMIIDSIQPIKSLTDESEKEMQFKQIRRQVEKLLDKVISEKEHINDAISALEITQAAMIAEAEWADDSTPSAEASDNVSADDTSVDDTTDNPDDPDLTAEPIDIASEIERVISNASPSRVTDKNTIAEKTSNTDEMEADEPIIWPDCIQPGAWFEIRDPKHLSIRKLKLSVILSSEELLIFVDKNGLKALEMTVEKLIDSLKSGDTLHVENTSVFDKSLSTAISQLSAVG